MTIALGILSRDWMVIAADTEITAGDSKAHGEKVYWAMDDPKDPDAGILAVTGAGDLAHLEAAYLELKELFLEHPSDGVRELGMRFKKLIKEFHRDYIVPYALCNDRPDIWLVVGLRRQGKFAMWETSKSSMRVVLHRYAAVGIGQMQAQELFNLLNKRMDSMTAKALAVYIVHRVKDAVRDVGKSTRVLCVEKNGFPHGLIQDQIEGLEKMFRFYSNQEAILVHCVLGNSLPFAQIDRIKTMIEHIQRETGRLLHPNRPSNSDMSQE